MAPMIRVPIRLECDRVRIVEASRGGGHGKETCSNNHPPAATAPL